MIIATPNPTLTDLPATAVQQRSARVISISCGRSGVGKTTIAANLALALSKMHRRAMLVDCDPGPGDATRMMGFNPAESIVSSRNPSCGTMRDSSPCRVPTNTISAPGARPAICRASAIPMYTCPPVPPPAIRNFTCQHPPPTAPRNSRCSAALRSRSDSAAARIPPG